MNDDSEGEMSRMDVCKLTNRLRAEQDQFEAFIEGAQSAFNHRGTFEDFDEFEKWLYEEWDEFREDRYE